MGFSYTHLGLCCDFCNNSGSQYNVKKVKCPYGWCQSWAVCTECIKKKNHLVSSCSETRAFHKDSCKFSAQKYDHEKLMEVTQ